MKDNLPMDQILTPDAIAFVTLLQRKFGPTREALLARRNDIQAKIDQGWKPDFLPETESVRTGSWTIAPVLKDLQCRPVEITGPVDRKMIINALNSGADVYMADFEDSHSPTWAATIQGQMNLRDAIRRQIDFITSDGKKYALNDKIATLMVRPRGWHLVEKHMLVDGKPVSASLFDFALFFFHNAQALLEKGTGPYFYLPKMESHLEARLWNDVFLLAQETLKIPKGTIKATVLIETILAAFEMDEILYELRDHSAGLNCGRWDYIFSFIKKFCRNPDCVLPDRAMVTMDKAFLNAYVQLLIKTCHRRGAHAMGGMAAQIPIKNDPTANEAAMEKVRADKLREVKAGHDGTWVAHPGLVEIAREVFKKHMKGPNQLDVRREDINVSASDLLSVPAGEITEAGLRTNVNVGLLYFEAWLRGNGCVPLYNLMEDAATCEISRSQIWQWIRHPKGKLKDGRKVTVELFRSILKEEMEKITASTGKQVPMGGKLELAAKLFDEIITKETFDAFLTLSAYEYLD